MERPTNLPPAILEMIQAHESELSHAEDTAQVLAKARITSPSIVGLKDFIGSFDPAIVLKADAPHYLTKLQTVATLSYFLNAFKSESAQLAALSAQVAKHQTVEFIVSMPITLKEVRKKKYTAAGTLIYRYGQEAPELLPTKLVFTTPLGSVLCKAWEKMCVQSGPEMFERGPIDHSTMLHNLERAYATALVRLKEIQQNSKSRNESLEPPEKEELATFIHFVERQIAEINRYFACKVDVGKFDPIRCFGANKATYKENKQLPNDIRVLLTADYDQALSYWADDLRPILDTYLPHYRYAFTTYLAVRDALKINIQSEGRCTRSANILIKEMFQELEKSLDEATPSIEAFYEKIIAALHAHINKQTPLAYRKQLSRGYLRVLIGQDRLPASLGKVVAQTSGQQLKKKKHTQKPKKTTKAVGKKAAPKKAIKPKRATFAQRHEGTASEKHTPAVVEKSKKEIILAKSDLAIPTVRLPTFRFRYTDNIYKWFDAKFASTQDPWDVLYHTYNPFLDALIIHYTEGKQTGDECLEYKAEGEILTQDLRRYFVIFHLIAFGKKAFDKKIYHRGLIKVADSEYAQDSGKSKITQPEGAIKEDLKQAVNLHVLTHDTTFVETPAYLKVEDHRNKATLWLYKLVKFS